jgi:membrane-bound lytic murein transglycosylase MltF
MLWRYKIVAKMTLQTTSIRHRWILGAILAVVTAACGSPGPEQAATSQTPSGAATQQPAASAAADKTGADTDTLPDQQANDDETLKALRKWTGDLDGMIERRVIRVLTVYSKTTFFVDKGAQLGLTADAFHLFEDDLNKKLKAKNLKVRVVFVPVAADDLIPALLQGRGDVVAAGKLVTEWRKEQVDFTDATRSGIASIVVTGPGVPPIGSVQDLGGKEVYIRASDVSSKNVERFNAQLAQAGKAPVKIRPAPEVLADEDLLEMVNAGLVPMTVVDDYVAEFWKGVFPGLVLNKSAAVKTDGDTAMMVRKGSPMLLAELNAFLKRYPEGSAQRNVLTNKYLKSVKYAKGATRKEDMARFNQTVEYLKKYSDKYDLDYLLMAAQGYQESGLDQNRRSAVGAIGVMQVMPATGADMKVGDITQTEANIHAGVKYVRFMIDTFYANEPMDKLEKGLFTFASYNAGPGRIKQLRERARKRGLDPNKWFNNVELVAAEAIGRETVQYVSNIYKYYLAYKLLSDQQQQRLKARGAGL